MKKVEKSIHLGNSLEEYCLHKYMYKTHEVAHLHNISKKALIYYDKIGLFKPQYVDETNNYRYYDRKEFPILKQIIYLKKIGFSLDEIKDLLQNRTHETIINALNNRHEQLNKELEALTQQKKSIDYLVKFYNQTKHIGENDLYRPFIKIIPDRKVFYYRCEKEGCREEVMLAYRRVLRHLDSLNSFSHQEYGTVYFKEGIQEGFSHHVGSFISLPSDFNIDNQLVLEGGKYISMYKKGGYYDEEGIKMLIEWINNNGYETIGDFYEFCLVDYTFTKNEDDMIEELQVRVR